MKQRKLLIAGFVLLAAFMLWTVLVCVVDVQAIGPSETKVGFAGINRYVHHLTGVHMGLYNITDWLGIVPLCMIFGFASLGVVQWSRRKRLCQVDRSILVLGGFYAVVMAAFVLFELIVINYRPVFIEGVLEASYPSSTTLLVLCIMPTAWMQFDERIRSCWMKRILAVVMAAFTIFMVVCRLISGVHWVTDIIGGILLSCCLNLFYAALSRSS